MPLDFTLDGKPFTGTINGVINLTSGSVPPPPPPPPPANAIDLSLWKLTLPTGPAEHPTEIFQPQLATYADANFIRNGDGSLTFRARADGVTTSSSGYPRSELREMKPGGKDEASWSIKDAIRDVMTLTGSCTMTLVARPKVVVAQIHDSSDDLMKVFVDGTNLNGKYIIGCSWGNTDLAFTFASDYKLGDKYDISVICGGGKVAVAVTYGGVTKTFNATSSGTGCYYKAGCYAQSSVAKYPAEKPDAYGQATIYALKVSHTAA